MHVLYRLLVPNMFTPLEGTKRAVRYKGVAQYSYIRVAYYCQNKCKIKKTSLNYPTKHVYAVRHHSINAQPIQDSIVKLHHPRKSAKVNNNTPTPCRAQLSLSFLAHHSRWFPVLPRWTFFVFLCTTGALVDEWVGGNVEPFPHLKLLIKANESKHEIRLLARIFSKVKRNG